MSLPLLIVAGIPYTIIGLCLARYVAGEAAYKSWHGDFVENPPLLGYHGELRFDGWIPAVVVGLTVGAAWPFCAAIAATAVLAVGAYRALVALIGSLISLFLLIPIKSPTEKQALVQRREKLRSRDLRSLPPKER